MVTWSFLHHVLVFWRNKEFKRYGACPNFIPYKLLCKREWNGHIFVQAQNIYGTSELKGQEPLD